MDNIKLPQSSAWIGEILDNICDAIYAVDDQWRLTYINHKAEEYWHCHREDLLGTVLWDLFPKHETVGWQMHDKASRERVPVQWQTFSHHLKVWVDFRAYPISDGGLAVYFRDITERKQAEEALRESEGKYHKLFNSIDEGFCIIEVLFDENDRPIDYRFLEVNQSFERQTGLVDAVGRCMRDMALDHEQHWFDIYGRIALTGEPVRFQNPAEALGHFYDVYAFRVGEPEQRRVAILFNDINERKQAEEALRKANKNKNEFINALSHELRNPLAAISAGLQLMDITKDEKHLKTAKQIINRQMGQLCRLVDDLLDLARITNNKIELKKEKVELNKLVAAAAEDHSIFFDEKGITLSVDTSAEPLYLYVDPVRLKQITGNLLHNAFKYTVKGGKTLIKVYKDANEAVICVKDDGTGIKPEVLPGLFKPFIQADMNLDRSNGGLGLGLAITKGIVELHGGNVSAYSEGLEKGSEFIIRLPLSDMKGYDEANEAKQMDTVTHSLKILIIEDNKDFADLLSTMLTTIGYDVNIAYDGRDGVKQAKKSKPDVIFCDIGLPGVDGYEVAKMIKNGDELKDVHLIALTGYASAGDLEQAVKAGYNRHLAKPIEVAKLQIVLNEAVGHSKG